LAERARKTLDMLLLREKVALVCRKMPEMQTQILDRNAGGKLALVCTCFLHFSVVVAGKFYPKAMV
jgi:hypothetical protein